MALPSRAFMRSWRNQTLPARRAALADSESHFKEFAERGDAALRDLALAALIGDALQPVEDLAHLGRAWDEPFGGLAYYVRATAYSSRTATNFWGSVAKWDDDRIRVFAGLYGRNPQTRELSSMIPPEIETELSDEQKEVLEAAEKATVRMLRTLLGSLGDDWRQFSPYYNAYKHGGLLVNREDVCWVDDEVDQVTDDTIKHDPSLATWDLRGRRYRRTSWVACPRSSRPFHREPKRDLRGRRFSPGRLREGHERDDATVDDLAPRGSSDRRSMEAARARSKDHLATRPRELPVLVTETGHEPRTR